jgi:Transcription elongation factor
MDIAVIVDESKVGKKIFLGNIVTYIDKSDNSTNTIKIVGTVEADPMAEPYPLISNESALGKALMGEIPGKVVTVQSEEPYEIEIVKAELSK